MGCGQGEKEKREGEGERSKREMIRDRKKGGEGYR
jgi:hypothetical protein